MKTFMAGLIVVLLLSAIAFVSSGDSGDRGRGELFVLAAAPAASHSPWEALVAHVVDLLWLIVGAVGFAFVLAIIVVLLTEPRRIFTGSHRN